jgi:hypothetical protein
VFKEVLVFDNPREDTLIVACNIVKTQLMSDGKGGTIPKRIKAIPQAAQMAACSVRPVPNMLSFAMISVRGTLNALCGL